MKIKKWNTPSFILSISKYVVEWEKQKYCQSLDYGKAFDIVLRRNEIVFNFNDFNENKTIN